MVWEHPVDLLKICRKYTHLCFFLAQINKNIKKIASYPFSNIFTVTLINVHMVINNAEKNNQLHKESNKYHLNDSDVINEYTGTLRDGRYTGRGC